MTREEQRKEKEKRIQEKRRSDYYSNDLMLPPECDVLCKFRPCFNKYEDKGSFSYGRGYTSYHEKFCPACGSRLNHGCPEWRDGIDDKVDEVEVLSFLKDKLLGKCALKGNQKRKQMIFCEEILEKLIELKEKQRIEKKETIDETEKTMPQ